jgi:L-ascorbate metabolism protein UlaG (beta-lactamase superfamily)
MLKTLFFTILITFTFRATAAIEARWLSISCIVLQDGETTLIFDPMFTRAGLLHWLNIESLKSNQQLVRKVLDDQKLVKVDAVFASHSHYDHVIDAPMISSLTGAVFYTDKNSDRIARAYRDPKIKTQQITNLQPIQIGKFKLTPIIRDHAPIRPINFEFLPGEVPETFNFSFYDYHVGETWFYYIEHPELKVLLDQGSASHLDKLKPFTAQADVIIQGIANRESDQLILDGYLKSLKPKIFIPIHFDNFFGEFRPGGEISYLPGIKWEGFLNSFEKAKNGVKLIKPKYGERMVLAP